MTKSSVGMLNVYVAERETYIHSKKKPDFRADYLFLLDANYKQNICLRQGLKKQATIILLQQLLLVH